MSDFEKSINASDLIDWIIETCPDWCEGPVRSIIDHVEGMPPAQPEQKVEELLPDGTLHLFTDTDLSKVNRVWVSQNGTHYGDLYYTDCTQAIDRKCDKCTDCVGECQESERRTDDNT